jgi:hypothetical protein
MRITHTKENWQKAIQSYEKDRSKTPEPTIFEMGALLHKHIMASADITK